MKYQALQERYSQESKDYERMAEQIRPSSFADVIRREMLAMDSVYYRVMGMPPSLFYDITKVRRIGNLKGRDRSEQLVLSRIYSDAVHHPFLKDEVWRLYEESLPAPESAAGSSGELLPAGAAADAFKAIVDRFQGNLVLVDFWATSCGPCIANIRSSKEQRKAFEAAGKLTYVFITEDRQSPQETYDQFVQDQELTNTFRVTRDEWNRFMQLFKFSGIPRYVLLGRDGRVLDDQFSPYNLEKDIEKYQ
jgi:thiol-disulfide isomerase/thioredoxin